MRAGLVRAAALGSGIVALVACHALAGAQSLESIEGLYEEGRLDEALTELEALFARGGDDPLVFATICARLAALRAGAGADGPAREAFLLLFAARPDAQLPADAGPAVERVFQQARRDSRVGALRVVLEAGELEGGTVDVRAGGGGAAAHLVTVTRAELLAGPERSSAERRGAGPHSLSLPVPGTARPLVARVSLLGPHGWPLASADRSVAERSPPRTVVGPPGGGAAEAPGPIAGRWWLWAGAAALVTAGVVVAVLATSGSEVVEVGAPALVGGR